MHLILCGGTRIVVLWGDKAFKIARLRPVRLLLRMLLFPFQSASKRARFYNRYGHIPKGLVNYVVWGLMANRNEFEYWNQTHDSRVMPVTSRFIGYLVIVQTRGEPVSDSELHDSHPLGTISREFRPTVRYGLRHQFAKRRGRVFLVDYGETDTCSSLKVTL